MKKQKISSGTIVRTVTLALALINQVLVMCGISVLPIEDQEITQIISTGFTIVTSIIAWWKNNSFTEKAIEADQIFKSN